MEPTFALKDKLWPAVVGRKSHFLELIDWFVSILMHEEAIRKYGNGEHVKITLVKL
jgi:hypothetical protein